jgi:hypothetical protein
MIHDSDTDTAAAEVESLERRADSIRPGDEVFTPAGRWETVTGVDRDSWRIALHTACGRRSFTWRFGGHTTLPVLRSWPRPEAVAVRLWEANGAGLREVIAAVASRATSAAVIDGHHLVHARWQGRGRGWAVYDLVTDETVTLGVSKAEAFAEVKRLARVHAKALGMPCETKAVNR